MYSIYSAIVLAHVRRLNISTDNVAAAEFISLNSISQRKIKHQYNKMVQLNTAVQIGCFQHLYLT